VARAGLTERHRESSQLGMYAGASAVRRKASSCALFSERASVAWEKRTDLITAGLDGREEGNHKVHPGARLREHSELAAGVERVALTPNEPDNGDAYMRVNASIHLLGSLPAVVGEEDSDRSAAHQAHQAAR
jgi:hypothetical protein